MIWNKRRTVPVAHRSRQRGGVKRPQIRIRLNARETFLLSLAVVFILVIITVPLRNYMQQRVEIAQIRASIAQKEAEKAQVIGEIEKYRDEDFIKEQARIRLGVIEPGELAFRVVDPALSNSRQLEDASEAAARSGIWYEQLWDAVTLEDSIAEPEEEEALPLPIAPTEDATPVP